MRRRAAILAAGLLLAPAALATAGCQGALPTAPDVEGSTAEPGPAAYQATGPFVRAAYPVTGRASYWIDAEGHAALAFDDAFSEPEVPDPVVLLTNASGLDGAVRVGKVSGDGAQRWTFLMPRGAVWRYAVIWSAGLGVEVGRAELVPGS